ncbi:LysR family transcriptional regulator [Shimia sp. R10_1]|uniref:LysR family transcriptional regulator n=1 Tax=Shimia sp. R10_1 TaxID=2821095 RepID=UPI001ADAF84A|nr:LysR family transcriptional regulator [Shimia sp. R10_1]MBO9475462.1 LysR family transcriptional regulator [Shimia sp. R10_1]
MDRLDMMKALVEVARQGGFAPAARQLDISTSALSRHIAALEDWLGVQLLHRTTRHVRLTDAGKGYLVRCQKVLQEIREIELAGQDVHGALSGQIRISAPVFVGRQHIAPVLAPFLRANPGVSVDLFLSDRLVDLVAEGFDMVIRVTKPTDSSLIARRLGDTRLCVVASPDYLAARGTPSTIEELAQHDCIIDRVPEGSGRWSFITQSGHTAQRVSGQARVNDGETARNFAMSGLGLARLPFFFVQEAIASGALIEIELDENPEKAGVFALYPPSRHLSQSVRAVIDLLVSEMTF